MAVDETLRKKIMQDYQTGSSSIQTIARINRVEVGEVLEIIGENDLTKVTFAGDLIDETEAGPGATMNYGRTQDVPHSTD